MIESLIQRLMGLPEWQVLGLATVLLLEGAFITVFPEEVIMCAMGVLWGQGKVDFPWAVVAIACGLLPANLFTVTIGHFFGMKVVKYPPFKWFLDPDLVERVLEPVRRRGVPIILATRFTPVIRGPVYLAVGTSGFGIARFIRCDWAAAAVQIPMWIFIGRWMGASADSLLGAFTRIGVLFGALLIGSVAFKLVWDRKKARAR